MQKLGLVILGYLAIATSFARADWGFSYCSFSMSVHGTVRHTDERPFPGATVTSSAGYTSTITNSQGQYDLYFSLSGYVWGNNPNGSVSSYMDPYVCTLAIGGMDPGQICASSPGYQTQCWSPYGEYSQIDFYLGNPLGNVDYTVQGRITKNSIGVANTKVTLKYHSNRTVFSLFTDGSGNYMHRYQGFVRGIQDSVKVCATVAPYKQQCKTVVIYDPKQIVNIDLNFENPKRSVRIGCTSPKGAYRECKTSGTILSATLARRTSLANRPCIAGTTWGFKNNFIWVTQGCAGYFNAVVQK